MNEINTIFYFPSSLTFQDYQTKLANEELSERTIVFAAAQNSIYMGGRQYGSYTNVTDVTRIIEENAYDDSTLREQLDALDRALQSANDTAAEEYAANHAFINGINTTIKNRIETLLNNSDWVDGHLPSGSNFGEQQVEAYLQRLGVWADGENHTKANATWTEIAQTTNSIQNTVNQIYQNDDLTQGFKQAITNIAISDTVKTEIGSYIATNYTNDLDDKGNHIIEVLEWLYSGMTSETSENSTFANLLSNAQIGTSTALSKISTAVTKVKNATGGDFTSDLISTTSITSQVNDSLATLKQSAGDNFVKTEIIGKINQTNDDIASIVSEITGNNNSSTSITNKISGWKTGLVTTATLDGAVASLLAANESNSLKSGLITYVKDNVGSFELATENDVTSASIVGKVNEAGSSININADKINLVGQTTFLDAVGRNITAQKFDAIAYYSGANISTEENSTLGFYEKMDPTDGFEIGIKYRPDTNTNTWTTTKLIHFHNTGQGEIGNNLINWDSTGIRSNGILNIGGTRGTVNICPEYPSNSPHYDANGHPVVNIGSSNGTVNINGNVNIDESVSVKRFYTERDSRNVENKVSIDKDGILILNPSGNTIYEMSVNGHFMIGPLSNTTSTSSLNCIGNIMAGGSVGNSMDLIFSSADVFKVSEYKVPQSQDENWSSRREDSWINGSTGIVEVSSGTLYFAICGGIIIEAGSLADCKAKLLTTFAYQRLVKDATVDSTDASLGLISGTYALMTA